MFESLETERLILKKIGYEDTEFFFREFSDPVVNRYLYDTEPCASAREAKEWIGFYLNNSGDSCRWVLVLKESGEKIGTCGFHCYDQENGEIELGYDLLYAYQKQGYMKEALKCVLSYIKKALPLQKIYAHISVDNEASIKTAQNQGFVRTGEQYNEIFRKQAYLHDIYCLTLYDK